MAFDYHHFSNLLQIIFYIFEWRCTIPSWKEGQVRLFQSALTRELSIIVTFYNVLWLPKDISNERRILFIETSKQTSLNTCIIPWLFQSEFTI